MDSVLVSILFLALQLEPLSESRMKGVIKRIDVIFLPVDNRNIGTNNLSIVRFVADSTRALLAHLIVKTNCRMNIEQFTAIET